MDTPNGNEAETLPRSTTSSNDTIPALTSPGSTGPLVRVLSSMPSTPGAVEDRYEVRTLLGRGGMGEVHACRDRHIGREVAVKVLRAEGSGRADAIARFEREARVQGQLEHPAVVPVYELSVDTEGRPYFTMKRLRGRTLDEVLDGLRAGNPAVEAEFSRRRLLAAFSQLCFAVEFAHSRGVLHRDIKPANVMFGDFGEVHLLDWGIATVVRREHPDGAIDAIHAADPSARSLVDASIDELHRTLLGEMVGTPGYMSREQIEGDPEQVDERADVFGLGAVLFETLTYLPLVEGTNPQQLLAKTLEGVDARAALRAPRRDVPPELEHVCIRATAPLEQRYATAGQLRDAVERFLDGDRDIATRRQLSEARVARADALLAGAKTPADEPRARALRELSAAVALDPSNEAAHRLLASLLFAGPRALPPAAREALQEQRASRKMALRRTTLFVSIIFLCGNAPLFWLGVRNWAYFYALVVANVLVPVIAVLSYVRRHDNLTPTLLMIVTVIAVSMASFIFGPLVLVPQSVLAVVIVVGAIGTASYRRIAIGLGLAAILVPLVLQLTGILPRSYSFEGGNLTIHPIMTELPETASLGFLTSLIVSAILLTAYIVNRSQRLIEKLEERLFLHAWNLRHLVPQGADGRLTIASEPPPSGGDESHRMGS